MKAFNSKDTKQERSGWRDMALSLRHRSWGYNAPAVDVDFLMIEYDNAEPQAIVSYKHINALEETTANREATRKLCNRAGLPYFEVVYSKPRPHVPAKFYVVAMNQIALDLAESKPPDITSSEMTESEFVSNFMYKLCRNREPEKELIKFLDNNPEWDKKENEACAYSKLDPLACPKCNGCPAF